MKTLVLLIGVIFLFSSCVVGTMTIKKVEIDQNHAGYQLNCEGWFYRCFSAAHKRCPDGYDILHGKVVPETYEDYDWVPCVKAGPSMDYSIDCTNGYKLQHTKMDYEILDIIIRCWGPEEISDDE